MDIFKLPDPGAIKLRRTHFLSESHSATTVHAYNYI